MIEIKRDDSSLIGYKVFVSGVYVGRFWKMRGNDTWSHVVGMSDVCHSSSLVDCVRSMLNEYE